MRQRLPSATVIGIDSDPLLPGLARACYGSAAQWVEADLGGPSATDEWRQWWDAIVADPHFTQLAQARADRIAERESAAAQAESPAEPSHHGNGLTVGEHIELLKSAGFAAVAPLWQVGDDHLLAARR
ncbi:hypothetical protein [Amycolatopsis sp. PS_44_ISF1]|uniref:hypothetical protein n=1 Tax=Amycolatopsis sp. PS_44_ISF1 TaxID=2974917 RepID=UPI0028DDDF3D|nr:hypothetical protein [Amycolatopsis sp. PS_44_ISF1]MDT8914951.1 hypothetical protein [Amycolatopsis sp. PS_44_ISF1]